MHDDRSDDAVTRLRPAFEPSSIAIVGASTNPRSPGYRYVKANADRGFEPIYPVNPGAEEVYGLPAYDSVLDVPGPVDLAIVLVRADLVPSVLRECGEAGVGAVHVGSSGFAESGTAEGRRLERELEEVAEDHDLPVIGPNCMGLYSPRAALTYLANAPEEPGPVGYVSHSGGFTLDLLTAGAATGLRFSLGASIGNAPVVDMPACIEYLLADDDTEVIGLYVEGVADRATGDRLVDVLRRADVPVVALKGGRTDRGGEAARSHTAALTGDYRVWRAVFEEAGVIEVDSLAEMVDMCSLLTHVRSVRGNAATVIGPGGGTTVVTMDACADAGIEVPPFADDTVEALETVDVPAAGNLRNPVDVPFSALFLDGGDALEAIVRTAAGDPGIAAAVVHLNATHCTYETLDGTEALETLADPLVRLAGDLPVPLLLVLRNFAYAPELAPAHASVRRTCFDAGIPVFDAMDRAVLALRRLVASSTDAGVSFDHRAGVASSVEGSAGEGR